MCSRRSLSPESGANRKKSLPRSFQGVCTARSTKFKAQNKCQYSSHQARKIRETPGLWELGVWHLAILLSFELCAWSLFPRCDCGSRWRHFERVRPQNRGSFSPAARRKEILEDPEPSVDQFGFDLSQVLQVGTEMGDLVGMIRLDHVAMSLADGVQGGGLVEIEHREGAFHFGGQIV